MTKKIFTLLLLIRTSALSPIFFLSITELLSLICIAYSRIQRRTIAKETAVDMNTPVSMEQIPSFAFERLWCHLSTVPLVPFDLGNFVNSWEFVGAKGVQK